MASSRALTATIRAMRGEVDREIVRAILGDWRMTCIVALTNSVHPTLRTLAALAGDLPSLLTDADIGHPDVGDAIRSLIGTEEGIDVLAAWALVAPAGWGAGAVGALDAAVRSGRCNAGSAAALIGPCPAATRLLETPVDAAFAVYRWGASRSDDPAWWAARLDAAELERLVDLVWAASDETAGRCVPVLPAACVRDASRMSHAMIGAVLSAFAAAPPVARQRHAALIRRLMRRTSHGHLRAIVQLACATESHALWKRVVDILRSDPDAADVVVIDAPWERLPRRVRTMVVDLAAQSESCAAIAAARGRIDAATLTPFGKTTAFFAALDPDVWESLPPDVQRQWVCSLEDHNAHLAIRSIGPRTDILARALMSDACVRAVRAHIADLHAVRRTLLPVAMRVAPLSSVPTLMDACPDPPDDAGAFLRIASACVFAVPMESSCESLLRTPADLAAAIVIRRVASYDGALPDRCDALRSAFRMRTREERDRLLSLLPSRVRVTILPDPQTIIRSLAHPDRRDAMRHALDRIHDLPSHIAVPALHAIQSLHSPYRMWALEALASTLRTHGALVADIIAACADAVRNDLFPPPGSPALTTALWDALAADPLVAHRLARAIRDRSWRHIRSALCALPPVHADSVAAALPDDIRSSLLDGAAACITDMITDHAHIDAMRSLLRRFAATNMVASLALASLTSDDPDEHARGRDVLRAFPQFARLFLPLLRPDVQATLRSCVDLRVFVADLHDDGASHAGLPQVRPRQRFRS